MDASGRVQERGERRVACAFLLAVACAPSLGVASALWWCPGVAGNALYGLGKGVLYGAPLLWIFWVERRPPSWSPARRGGLGVGLAHGLALGAALLGLYALVGPRLDPGPLREALGRAGLDVRERFLAMAAYLVLVNAALEEYAFRWFVYERAREVLGSSLAPLGSALVFTAHHVLVLAAYFGPLTTALGSLAVLGAGLLWSWSYRRFGSIWPGWASHVLADVALMVIGWRLLFAP